MRLPLWLRLFLAFATLSTVALGSFVVWQQQSFRRGFRDYLDQVAVDRLGTVANALAAQFAAHGSSWEFLRADPRQFERLLDPTVRPDRGPQPLAGHPGEGQPDAGPRPISYAGERPPPRDEDRPPPPPRGDRPPPPREAGPPPPRDDGPPPPGRPPGEHRPPPRPPGAFDLAPRVRLLDAAGIALAGNPELGIPTLAVPVTLDGKAIGSLRLAPLPPVLGDLDQAFAGAQAHDAMLAGLIVLAAAFLFALLLAYRLLQPVFSLARGTRALAAGDYTQRVVITRRDEFGDLAGDFNHLARTLEQHRTARRQWGADIAHELRTPLSILRGEIQALQDGIRRPDAAALASLQAESERLTSLVDDLYQLALADAGALDYRFAPVDLDLLVREAVELQAPGCADAGLSLATGIVQPGQVRGDARRLSQLLDNLLANARRYTDAPGRIEVSLQRRGATQQLCVDDSKPGVPDAALPRLFERLYRVEGSRNRAAGGAGLGLAICRAIVDAHGGSIEALPSPLGGLRICIRLPLQPAGEA